jgi:hypothetical protein
MNLTNLYFETLLKQEKFKTSEKKMEMSEFESLSSPTKNENFRFMENLFL